ncbi:hypothetical protein DPMN_159480 [Dreissena polymorpha]|uniref:Uncharacterized protein n=1 Tax=Dreissena polymorpha TaxID=45954 RepID=A0A9D4IMV6_DREPO|nr:hypothetical protein DPMN_159480 [Dreissena polymorpha]
MIDLCLLRTEEESQESAELEPGLVDTPDLADLRRFSLNTQDSGIFANAPIKCGSFEIEQDPIDMRNKVWTEPNRLCLFYPIDRYGFCYN